MDTKLTAKEALHQQIYILRNRQNQIANDVNFICKEAVENVSVSKVISTTFSNLFKETKIDSSVFKTTLMVVFGFLSKGKKKNKVNPIVKILTGVLANYLTNKLTNKNK